MAKTGIIRSPFFYVGDKYKLMPQLKQLMPENIKDYIEPFVGGGSSFLNSTGKKYVLNDVDKYVIKLHKELMKYVDKKEVLLKVSFSIFSILTAMISLVFIVNFIAEIFGMLNY